MNTVPSSDGTTNAFDQSGEGPALILVGGAFQYRAIDPRTAHLAALLASRFTVFRYDRRGRGDSGDTAPYAVEREIEDFAALIAKAGGSAFVFGMSSGAVLALEAAGRGLAITKLALYEPPFIVNDSGPALPAEYSSHLTELVAAGRRGDAVEYFMMQAAGMPPEAVAPMRQSPMWPMLEAVAHTLPYDDAIMGDTCSGSPLLLARWASVTVPTLVMDGGASPASMGASAQALVDVLRHAQRRTLEGQTHEVAPEVLAPIMEAFFLGV
ncbi:MAG: alpha/beta fold hydrolase [Ktedonobacterales bacterium]